MGQIVPDAVERYLGGLNRASTDVLDDIAAEQMHDLRRRVVEHRYQMELFEPAWPRMGKDAVARRLALRISEALAGG